MVTIMVFLLMAVFNVVMTFNYWWLSYWLEQGAGVSATVGEATFLWACVEWGAPLRAGEPRDQPRACHCQGDRRSSRHDFWEQNPRGTSLLCS